MSDLTKEQELQILLDEARSRGMNVEHALEKRKIAWPVSSEGYFIKRDGTFYVPSENQGGFVHTTSYFSAFIGPRGCISPDALLGEFCIGDLINSEYSVPTLFGNQKSLPSFLKGKDHLYRIRAENDREAQVTLSHRILTPNGWHRLQDLSSQDLVFLDGTSNGSIEKKKGQDYLDSYSLDFHLNGVLCSLLEVAFLNMLLQLHKTVFDDISLDFSFLLSIVDFYAVMLSRLSLLCLTSSISYQQLYDHSHNLLLSLDSFLQTGIFRVSRHHQESIYDSLFPSLSLFRNAEELYLLDFEKLLQHLRSPQCLVSDLSFPKLERIEDIALSIIRWADLAYRESFLLEYQIPHKFFLRHNSKYQTLSRQALDFESLGIVEQLVSSLGMEFSLPFDISSLHNLSYYTAFFGEIQDIGYYKFGEYYDVEVPLAEHYSSGGMYHHNSGKTTGGAQKALRKLATDNGDGAVLNPDFTNFKDSTWPEFREWIPWEMVVPSQRYRSDHSWKPQQPFTLSFINGRNVICKGLKDPDSARGPNINWLWYDEAQRDKTGEAWKIAIASVRVGKNPQAFVTATPAGKQHWMFDFFVSQNLSPLIIQVLEEMGYEGNLIDWYHGTREDNKENLDKMYIVSLMAGYADDSYLYKQEVEGLFVSPEGTIGDRNWFNGKILKDRPDISFEDDVRYWDLAATEKKIKMKRGRRDPDATCGTRMLWDGDEDFYIQDQVHGRWGYENILDKMYETAIKDGPFVKIYVEQEPGAGGKNQIAAIQKFFREGDSNHRPLPEFSVQGHRPEGDKVMRANIWFPSASRGHMWLIEGDWNEPFLDEVDIFADGDYDDRVDSTSGARICVAPIISWASPGFLSLGTPLVGDDEE